MYFYDGVPKKIILTYTSLEALAAYEDILAIVYHADPLIDPS